GPFPTAVHESRALAGRAAPPLHIGHVHTDSILFGRVSLPLKASVYGHAQSMWHRPTRGAASAHRRSIPTPARDLERWSQLFPPHAASTRFAPPLAGHHV